MWRARQHGTVVLCIAAVLVGSMSAEAHPLDLVPFDDTSYADLYRLAADGLAPLWASTVRPLTRREVARVVAQSLDHLVADRAAFSRDNLITLEQLVLQFADELALLGYRVVEPPQGPSAQAVTGWGAQLARAVVWRAESGTPPSSDGFRIPAPGSRRWASDAGSWFRLEVSGTAGLGPLLMVGARLEHAVLPGPVTIGIDRLYASAGGDTLLAQAGRERHRGGAGARGGFFLSDNARPPRKLGPFHRSRPVRIRKFH